MPDLEYLRDFAERYTAAWCSQDSTSVAAFYSPNGSLKINEDLPAVGRSAITDAVQAFMNTFPDLQVIMDDILMRSDHAVYHWTLKGTNTGPSGIAHQVHISGFEEWKIGVDGLIAESQGHYDSVEYKRQLEQGNAESS